MKEMWNQRFAAGEYYYGKEPNPWFKEKMDSLVPGSILVPADGEGRNGVYAATLGWQVTAIDFSEEGRKKALLLASEKNVSVQYLIGDISQTDFGTGKYDAVAMIYVHMPPPVRREVHRKLVNSLKPGGWFILEAFNPKQITNTSGGPKTPDMLYTVPILQEDFHDIEIIELNEYRVYLEAGDGHSGPADIIRFFGRK